MEELVKQYNIDETLLHEILYLLYKKQPNNCLNWFENSGDCNKVECDFCRIKQCINNLENILK